MYSLVLFCIQKSFHRENTWSETLKSPHWLPLGEFHFFFTCLLNFSSFMYGVEANDAKKCKMGSRNDGTWL
jgi:hypothetical protein